MKLWIKLALIIFIITNILIEIVLFVVKPQVKNHYVSLLGEKLKSTAAASAVAINGEVCLAFLPNLDANFRNFLS
ncbi:MAG: hypothetical protein Q8M94_12375 [Ignavibacteria bacterium]|nr:hypothetical protein [Ignavibacteria bacterium]